jgi:DNA-binding winged helix-turn-helix (wHTH) protein/TolB-like protein/tetratricopeptide (TPR) repeat protein
MNQAANHSYAFGTFHIDAVKRLLLRDGKVVPLTPKCFDLLLALVETPTEVIGKDELMKRIWPDSFVEEGNLTYNISMLRKALGEKAGEHQYIVTIPGRGYRFSANVTELQDEEIAESADPVGDVALKPETHTAEEKTAVPVFWGRQRAVLIFGFALLVAAAIYFLSAGRSDQPRSGVAIKSLAVLPFKSLDAGESDEYIGLGMADTLITRLSNLRKVLVRPTSSVLKYIGKDPGFARAGHELDVEAILEGSVRRSEDKIRVTVQLINVRDSSPIWAGTFDAKMTGIFNVEDSIAERVAEALALPLTGVQKDLLAKRYTESYEAYQLYIQGIFFWNQRTRQGIQKAIDYFRQALAKDPNYALAYAGLADCYVLSSAEEGQRDILPKAREAATKALEIDNNLSEAHSSLGAVKQRLELDWPGSESELRVALDLNPNNAVAHFRRGMNLATMGRFDEAEAEIQKSLEIDPFSIPTRKAVPHILFWSRRNDEAIAEYKKVIEMAPDFPLAQRELGLVYEQKGMYPEALEQLQKSLALPTNYFKTMNTADLAHVYAVWGKISEARKVLEELIRDPKQRYASEYGIAVIYAGLGEKDKAIEWLNKAYEDRSFWMIWVKNDSRLDGLRSDSRFTDLLRRMKIYA